MLKLVVHRIQSMQRATCPSGVCPGYPGHLDQPFSSVVASHHRVDAPAESVAAVIAVPDLSRIVSPPSAQELTDALLASSNLDYSNHADCFRVLVIQNSVIIRDALYRQQLLSKNGESSSLGTSLTTSSHSSLSSSRSSDGGCENDHAAMGIIRPSPPKNFQCPVCLQLMNEKDFDRHVKAWIAKCENTGPVKSGHCGGIRDPRHPLLSRFPYGSFIDRVRALVSDIRSLIRPGAYDSLSSEGSGRHIFVARRFAELQTP